MKFLNPSIFYPNIGVLFHLGYEKAWILLTILEKGARVEAVGRRSDLNRFQTEVPAWGNCMPQVLCSEDMFNIPLNEGDSYFTEEETQELLKLQ